MFNFAADLGCFKDVLLVADKWCTGKNRCRQRIYDSLFATVSGPDQCQSAIGNYVDMTYTCHTGEPRVRKLSAISSSAVLLIRI